MSRLPALARGVLPSLAVPRVAVVGAGAAGLAAARRISDSGVAVSVFDKARGVGGRLATRRVGKARIDHGAQFFTTRSPSFDALTRLWVSREVAYEWCRGFAGAPDGHPRYAGREGMTALAKDLAAGLDVFTSSRVSKIVEHPDGWLVESEPGTFGPFDAVILNPPAPQSADLLSGASVDRDALDELTALRYEPAMAALVALPGPASLPSPGGLKIDDGPVSWVADNQAKGVSAVPALTVHGRGDWSAAMWDRPDAEVLAVMLDSVEPYLGGITSRELLGPGASEAATAELQRWRYATPLLSHERRCLMLADTSRPVVAAGDAFGEAKVEGAVLSGWAAADEVLRRLL